MDMKKTFLLLFFLSLFFTTGCMSTRYIVAVRMEPKTPDIQIFVDGKMVGKTTESGFAQVESEKMSIFKDPLLEVKNDEYYGFLKLDYLGSTELGHNVKTASVKNVEMDRFYEVIFLYNVNDLSMVENVNAAVDDSAHIPQMEENDLSMAGNVNAEFKIDKSKVCEFLTDLGYPTHGWRHYYGNDYGCTSPSKEIGFSGPVWAPALKNNLAYIVNGTATKVIRLMLIVNINNLDEADEAHKELLRTAVLLIKKSLNKPLPNNIREAIIKGKNISSKIGNAHIDVILNDWPTGKGYDIKVIIN